MVWSAAHPHVSKLQRMLWQSLSRHLLQYRLRRTPRLPTPSSQCTGHTGPHLLCVSFPIDCTIRDSWIQRDQFLYHTPAHGWLLAEGGFHSFLWLWFYIFLVISVALPFFFPALYLQYTYWSFSRLPLIFALKVTVIPSFLKHLPSFLKYLLCGYELFRLRNMVNTRPVVDLQYAAADGHSGWTELHYLA